MARSIETVLLSLLLVASAGCGSHSGDSTNQSSQSSPDSGATASATAKSGEENKAAPAASTTETQSKAEAKTQPKAEPVAQAGHVRLLEKGCVQFEPHWISVGVGKSLTWDSELKAPVTIHVPAGAFAKTEFVVRPGASVSSGPARTAGDYAISSAPAACQGAPRGARGSGPGLTVEASGH